MTAFFYGWLRNREKLMLEIDPVGTKSQTRQPPAHRRSVVHVFGFFDCICIPLNNAGSP